MPKMIRSDNGAPFAVYNTPLGIGRLSVIWMALGILPDRITPGKLYQNGSHERRHRDLKQGVQKVNRGSINYYQNLIDQWRYYYNHIRPHETLGMVTPAIVYSLSPRDFDGYIDEICYPNGFERRKVCKNGYIKYDNQSIRITSSFSGYHIGLAYEDEYTLDVWFSNFPIGKIDLVSSSFYTVAK